MITVVVVDDEALLRAGIVRLVESDPGLRVVGEGGDGRAAIELVRVLAPDVLLVDMQMPVLDGLDAIASIHREHPEVAVIVLTSFLTDEYLVPALRAGAVGYLLKDSTPQELHHGIRAAAAGDSVLSPAVAQRLIAAAGSGPGGRRSAARARLERLAPQEREVVVALAEGLTNAEIGARLFLAESTVKAYLANAMTKLGTSNRTQTAILAHEAELPADN
ncbi:response regulator [Agromyces seonyuensis]|uniref:Response regulator n=1 Tax=Agromyces seonyuensis TaxID=2662446 RepID=A0A6I4NW49_9MICO|nr:response regulator transcription factor [Agromyces seonyuensis]MWB98588.1 response regulator [Agromyces seonyuensis]